MARPGDDTAERSRALAGTRAASALFVLLLVLVLALAYGARVRGLGEWLGAPESHFSQGVPGSSSDSYYWFRLARELVEGRVEPGGIDPLRAWPEGLERGPTPAFPWLIAATARLFEGDVYRTALVLNVFLSGLFVVPLALYGRRIGLPGAGLLAGFVGSLAPAYVQRASVHRVDTDGGTLFFVCLLALGLASLRPDASPRRNALVAAATGVVLALFCRWYGQPGFWLVYVGTLGLQLLAGGFARREGLRLGLLFAVCANPLNLLPGLAGLAHFVRYYVVPSPAAVPSPLDYANVTRDITELQPLPLRETLAAILDVPAVAAIGLLGFVAFAGLRARAAIPLLPMALLGLYALIGPMRFGMYLAPLAGLGLGFLLHGALGAIARRAGWAAPSEAPAAALAAGLAALALLGHTGFFLAPKPTLSVRTIASLQALAPKLPPGAAILTSWGNGYVVQDVVGAATLTDGEAPDPLVHYLFSRAITSPDPDELTRIAAVLSTRGRSALHAALDDRPDPAAAVEALLRREARSTGEVVLLLGERDLAPFGSFFRTGRFDFARGEGPEETYHRATCERAGADQLRCRNGAGEAFGVDRRKGRLSGGTWLRRIVEIGTDGGVRVSEHAAGAGFSLELVPREVSGTYTAYLVSEATYQSNFNQLFLLGRWDPTQIEEIHRDLPVLRAFRILPMRHTNLLDGKSAIHMMEPLGGPSPDPARSADDSPRRRHPRTSGPGRPRAGRRDRPRHPRSARRAVSLRSGSSSPRPGAGSRLRRRVRVGDPGRAARRRGARRGPLRARGGLCPREGAPAPPRPPPRLPRRRGPRLRGRAGLRRDRLPRDPRARGRPRPPDRAVRRAAAPGRYADRLRPDDPFDRSQPAPSARLQRPLLPPAGRTPGTGPARGRGPRAGPARLAPRRAAPQRAAPA